MQPKHKTIPYKIPGKPWVTTDAVIFILNNSHFLCIIDYHSNFPVVKPAEGQSAEQIKVLQDAFELCKVSSVLCKQNSDYLLLERLCMTHSLAFSDMRDVVDFCTYI